MQIYRTGTSPITRALESTFTGDVLIGGYFRRQAPSRLAGATATSTPGSRTPWKVNPAGQTLVVVSGVGWAQLEGVRSSTSAPETSSGVRPDNGTGKVRHPTMR